VDARTIAAGMAGTVHPQDVHTQLQALELDAMATADGSRKLYVITEEGKQLLWDLRR
jgi:DNA-binding PadR family transcriptional regulator